MGMLRYCACRSSYKPASRPSHVKTAGSKRCRLMKNCISTCYISIVSAHPLSTASVDPWLGSLGGAALVMAASAKQQTYRPWILYLGPLLLAFAAIHLRDRADVGQIWRTGGSLLSHLQESLGSRQHKPDITESVSHEAIAAVQRASEETVLPVLGTTQQHSLITSNSRQPTCHLQGSVDECCNCTYQAVDDINGNIVYPTLKRLVATPFFRYFKVNLWCDCPLWPDDGMCALRACSVCECEPHELPKPWLAAEARTSKQPQADSTHNAHHTDCQGECDSVKCAAEADAMVDRDVEPSIEAGLQHIKGWRGLNNPWMAEGESDEDYLYINLLANPERYTGYQGEHAHRIWSAIYNQSCFTELKDDCMEKRVFYRLISGMHTSISAHIAANYLLDEEAGTWGPSPQQFKQRLGRPELRDRVENLYFAYLFVLRAVTKAGSLLEKFEYDTGMPQQDAVTKQLIADLLSHSELHSACPMPFDEGRLWRGEQGPQLLGRMQATFRNITRIMDCVGCEKCKLWGKLQTLGIATALKVLFSSPDCAGNEPVPGQPFSALTLERNEVIALLNLLERFAASLQYYHVMSQSQVQAEPTSQLGLLGGLQTVH